VHGVTTFAATHLAPRVPPMSDLIESRISEIRERLTADVNEDHEDDGLPRVTGGRMDRTIADFRRACRVLLMEEQEQANPNNALVTILCDAVRLSREYIHDLRASAVAPSDLEALLAEREGMKAEIARLTEHAKEWRDVANQRALEMIDLSADAERMDWLEAEHSRVDPVMRLTVKEHHFRESPLWANVDGAREGIDTARRCAVKELRIAGLESDLAEARSPDREAGSGTAKTRTITRCPYHANRDVECAICTAVEVYGGFTFVGPSHPVPSEGGGE
jgi:hypothetical protein